MNYHDILKSVILTEKSNYMVETDNKYTFLVDKNATKGQVKEAIEKLYDVKVINVNVAKLHSKTKRSWNKRRMEYIRPRGKKAIVQLKENDSIKLFEESKK